MLDVREIANLVLDHADAKAIGVTNMALNKIIYFVYCDHLIERADPLVGAKIEAWQHGPVFREVYHQFKQWNDGEIRSRAVRVDPDTGNVLKADAILDEDTKRYIESLIGRYVGFTAAQLRAMSHRVGGPWHKVWGHDGRANPGMRITNQTILDLYGSGARQ